MKSYLVTGAGSGIGRSIAIKLASASEKNSVILVGRNRSSLEETKSLLPNPRQHEMVSVDLRRPNELRDAFLKIDLPSRNLVAVVANAGVGGDNIYGPNDRWSEILETNLSGTYYLVNEALPSLRASKDEYKHILIVSSILARMGVPRYSAYCASKAGLLGLMRSWASEFADEKILVNAICPGWVRTKMAELGIELLAKAESRPYTEALKAQMEMVPLKKMSEPEEIATFVQFLVSTEQKSITGQSFDINNGALMP